MNPRHPRLVDAMGVAVMLGLAGLAWWLGVRPVLEARELADAERQRAADAEAEATSQEQGVAQLRSELARAQLRQASTRVRLSHLEELNQRVGLLTRAATGSGLVLEQITPGQAEPRGRLARVPIRLAARGTYAAAAGFLSHLHAEFPDVAVTSLRLEAASENKPGESRPGALEIRIVWHASVDAPDEKGGARSRGSASAEMP